MHFMVWKALPIVTCHMDCSRETAQLCTPPRPRVESPFQVAGSLSGVRFPVLPFNQGVQPSKPN